MPADVVVIGVGMVTAVGLTAAETAASVRSATARFAETSMMDKRFEPFTLAEVPEDGLPELAESLSSVGLTARETRMLRLGAVALNECLKSLPQGEAAPGLALSLPETDTTRALDGQLFLQRFAQQAARGFDGTRSDASHRGRAGGLAAVGQAAEIVRTGRARFMLAGGIDTYRDLYVLGTLDMEQRVKSAANLDGFIPGEGAAFLLLSRAEAGAAPPAPPSQIAPALENGHPYSEPPHRGEGRAAARPQRRQSGAAPGPPPEGCSAPAARE